MSKAASFRQLIDDGVLEIGDGYRAKNAELGGNGPIFLRSAYLQDSGFVEHMPERFAKEDVRSFGGKVAQLGDVVITTKGNSTGRVGVIRAAQVGAVYSPHLSYWRSRDAAVLYQGFLQVWSSSPEFKAQLAGKAYSTDMAPYLSLRDQLSLSISFPPLPEQRAIAATLGALDDKIELNRKMNATLEAMARALFRDWFVDFGPTRAKMEGRPPYLSPDLWSLFPDRLDDEGKPEGWEVSTIGDEVRVVGGSTPSTKDAEFWDGGINWATPKDLSNLAAPVLLETSRTISQAGLAKISSGLLPAGTLLLSSRAPIGYLAIAEVPVAINQGFIGMICEKRVSNVVALLWTLENMAVILAKANGSTFQEISKGNFRPLPVVVAPEPVLRAFDAIAKPLYERIARNEREARTLAQTRDLLLPRLMSGQLRVAEAEQALEAAS